MASNSDDGISENNTNCFEDDKNLKEKTRDQKRGAAEKHMIEKRVEMAKKNIGNKKLSSEPADRNFLKFTSAEKNRNKFPPSLSNFKEVEESKSRVMNWRDPKFQYKRTQPEVTLHKNFSTTSNFNLKANTIYKSNLGWWGVFAATDKFETNGKTESENLKYSLDKMYKENKAIFSKPNAIFEVNDSNKVCISCFTSDYTDKHTVFSAGKIIRKYLPSYSFSILYGTKGRTVFMNLPGDEFYEFIQYEENYCYKYVNIE